MYSELTNYGFGYLKSEEYDEAYKCFLEGSLQEDPIACICLGNMYLRGYYPKKDYKKAFSYYKHAFDLKNDESIAWDAIYFITDQIQEIAKDKKAIELYVDYLNYLIEHEMWSICITLGAEYNYGLYIEKDVDKAIELYLMAAEHGIDYGYDCLGELYFEGDGIEKDYDKAYEYFQKSKGDYSNIKKYYYGEMYREGIIFEKNLDKAKEYYLMLANDKKNKEVGDLHYELALDRLEVIEDELL